MQYISMPRCQGHKKPSHDIVAGLFLRFVSFYIQLNTFSKGYDYTLVILTGSGGCLYISSSTFPPLSSSGAPP